MVVSGEGWRQTATSFPDKMPVCRLNSFCTKVSFHELQTLSLCRLVNVRTQNTPWIKGTSRVASAFIADTCV